MHDKLSTDVIVLAFPARALYQRSELLGVNHLVNFVAAGIARVNCHLHEWPHITCARDDSSDGYERANLLSPNFPHFDNALLRELAWHEHNLITTLKFLGNLGFGVGLSAWLNEALVGSELLVILEVEFTLVHNHVECGQVFIAEVHGGLGHVLVAHD